MTEDRLLPLHMVSDKMGIKRRTLYKYIDEGLYFQRDKISRFPNGYRIRESEVNRVMDSFRVED